MMKAEEAAPRYVCPLAWLVVGSSCELLEELDERPDFFNTSQRDNHHRAASRRGSGAA